MLQINDVLVKASKVCGKQEERTRRTVVANMLRNGRDEKEIQMALGLPANQVSELIRDVQANSQEYFGK